MVYNPATDFIGLWRASGGNVVKAEMPGLDYVVQALARAGIINLAVAATPPVANQSTTAWLQTAVPSYSAEGVLRLWDKVTTAYLAATPALFLQLLEASAGENGVSWWTSAGGPPLNTVGNNGDFAVRTDAPNGIYGPKALGAWPAQPVPGTADVITSVSLDNTFGVTPGELIYRGALVWQALGAGANNTLLSVAAGLPAWATLSSLLDAIFGAVRGSIIYRGAAAWAELPPDTAGKVLSTNGPGADPAWSPRTAEFPSGTVMLFQQTTAPTGWTKQTSVNDYGLRVVSGAVGATPGTPFSTIFAQTTVGNTTLTVPAMPSHNHPVGGSGPSPIYNGTGAGIGGGGAFGLSATFTIGNTGGDGPHSHPINLSLAYVDVIIASKN